jgi:hypothetical protein
MLDCCTEFAWVDWSCEARSAGVGSSPAGDSAGSVSGTVMVPPGGAGGIH